MAYSEELADRVRERIFERSGVVEKEMFGGVAWMIDGNMAVCIIGGDGLMVRLPKEEVEAALAEPGVEPMEMSGKRMKSFVVVQPDSTESDEDLLGWIDAGASFAESLPSK